MSERAARTWGWILVGLGVVGVGLIVLFMTGAGHEEGCTTEDRLPGICQMGDGSGAFSETEEGSQYTRDSTDLTLLVLGLLVLAVGGGGARFAFRRARQLPPMVGPSSLAGTISSGRLASLGVASNAGMPVGVMLGQTGVVTSASDGTYQPVFWCLRHGHVHISVTANGELAPISLSVPVGEAHALLRQWAHTQELRFEPSDRAPVVPSDQRRW
jgi:hypothetical protein